MTDPVAPPSPSNTHREQQPRNGFIGRAAKLVERMCLLPEPEQHDYNPVSAWFRSFSYPRNYLSEKDCAERHVRAEARQSGVPAPVSGTRDFAHIMKHARDFAATDAKSCIVRDYEDDSEKSAGQLYGYRGADKKCHTTPDQNTAQDARRRFPQTR